MDNYKTARPYAKAIFNIGVKNNNLQEWLDLLTVFSQMSENKQFHDFILDPCLTSEKKTDILLDATKNISGNTGRDFIKMLINNKRFIFTKELKLICEKMANLYQNLLYGEAISCNELNAKQKEKLIDALSVRFKKKITLDYKIDKFILGGIIIRVGDYVIDASLINKLEIINRTFY